MAEGEQKETLNETFCLQTSFILRGALEVSDQSQNSRLGSALAQIPDMNGDGFRELVVGAPLEDDHQGAVYVFYGHDKTIQPQYRQVRDAEPEIAGIWAGNPNCVNPSSSFSSVCPQLGFLQVCSISVEVFMAFWMSMQTDSSISQWERWELL